MKKKIFASALAAALIALWVGSAVAAASRNAGFRTAGVWSEDDRRRMDLNIWFPTKKQEKDLNYSPWIIGGAPNAKISPGKFPLIILSHSTAGNRFSHHELAARLARQGFIVCAPTHARDNLDNMDDLFTWRQLLGRVEETDWVIDYILKSPDFAESVEPAKIGYIGFGTGAAAGLLLGGAEPNCANWYGYCDKGGAKDVYCQKWTKDKVRDMCAGLPLSEKTANPAIKAMALVAPAYGMMFDKYSFENYAPETLLVGAVKDKINSVKLHCEPIARSLGKRARYYELPEADMGALISRCPPSLETEMPDLCLSVTPEIRRKTQRDLASAIGAFFLYYLPPDK